VNDVLHISPGFELGRLDDGSRGRFQIRWSSQSPVEVCSVQFAAADADGQGSTWRLEMRDRAGVTVGTLELWPERLPGNGGLAAGKSSLETLTRRQREILELVAQGCAVKTIASRLAISVKTVEFHKTRLMRRLGMHGTAELTRFAVATGLISI
jgi:DNA-binding CsgD family transcriptional regulator